MRILYMSDLHLEMDPFTWRLRRDRPRGHPRRGPRLDPEWRPDLIVLAGDISGGLAGIAYAEQIAAYLRAPAVYVAGNHEFYRNDVTRLLAEARNAAARSRGRVHFLENATARLTLAGRTLNILGCTLWTDYALDGDATANAAMAFAARHMNDHRMISESGTVFTPLQARDRHMASRNWLRLALAHLAGQTSLIVSHHAPSAACLGPRTGQIAPAYASRLIPLLRPTAWIHGHTHLRHVTQEDGVIIGSAPSGYGADAAFTPGLMEL